MQISVKSDIKAAQKKLNSIQRKQIPYAASRAINDVAFDARKAEVEAVTRHIDRPAPFTKSGFRVTKSTKQKLAATLEIPPDRWKYMKYQVAGGTQVKGHVLPVNIGLNRFGAVGKGKVKKLLGRKNTFEAEINGTKGVWQRTGGKRSRSLKLLVSYKPKGTYSRRYPFGKAAEKAVRINFSRHMDIRLKQALATAR